jgi:hypothetical protein
MNRRIEVLGWVVLAGAVLSLGCASQTTMQGPNRMLCPPEITTAQAVEAAHRVLAGMHFPIEKLDVEEGIIKTRPLQGAQFFEFWRSDNVGAFNAAEANLHSIRRIVEVRVKASDRDGVAAPAHLPTDWIDCHVQVQRLALPANEVAGSSQAYQMHTRSTSTLQRFEVTPQQRAQMAWIDLGHDPELAAEILRRIGRRLGGD